MGIHVYSEGFVICFRTPHRLAHWPRRRNREIYHCTLSEKLWSDNDAQGKISERGETVTKLTRRFIDIDLYHIFFVTFAISAVALKCSNKDLRIRIWIPLVFWNVKTGKLGHASFKRQNRFWCLSIFRANNHCHFPVESGQQVSRSVVKNDTRKREVEIVGKFHINAFLFCRWGEICKWKYGQLTVLGTRNSCLPFFKRKPRRQPMLVFCNKIKIKKSNGKWLLEKKTELSRFFLICLFCTH